MRRRRGGKREGHFPVVLRIPCRAPRARFMDAQLHVLCRFELSAEETFESVSDML